MTTPREYPKRDLAMQAPSAMASKFIVFSPTARRYYRFDGETLRDCVEAFRMFRDAPSSVADFQEVIIGTDWHRLAFDLDVDIAPADEALTSSEAYRAKVVWFRGVIREIIAAASDVYYDTFSDVITREDFIVCESLDEREPARISAHITIARSVPNNVVASRFTDLVNGALPAEMRGIIDQSLNSKQHNLRLAGCMKPGSIRVKKIPEGKTLFDTLVSAPARRVPEECVRQWAVAAAPSPILNVASKHVKRACELIDAKYGPGVHTFRAQAGSLISFKRHVPSFCDICARTHDHDNTVMIKIATAFGETQFRELCRRSLNASSASASASASGSGIVLESSAEEDAIANVINTIERPSALPNRFAIPTATYSEAVMRDLPPEPRTLFIRAPMKLGKTKALRKFVSEHVSADEARVIFVSFRRTFSSTIAQKFPEFVLYTDIQGALDANKMIVQVESLHRIVPDKLGQIDLLIMDESESIIEQFDSTLSSNRGGDFAVFQWLIKTARRCIAMDAFMSERTYAVIARMRGVEGALLVKNEYQNACDEEYYFTSQREQWLFALLQCIDAREKIVVCANSATEGRALCELLQRKTGEADEDDAPRIKFYCAETSPKIKQRDFMNVDESWTECDVLIYTPTLTAGVSFEREHFDRLFGYFTDKSCSAQTCIQMMGRIRNIAQHQTFICIQSHPGSFPETRDEMLLALRVKKHAILSTDAPDIEYSLAGLPQIPDTDYAELRVQNACARNRSRNDFTGELMRMIAETGASCQHITRQLLGEIFGEEPSFVDLARIREERMDVGRIVSARAAQAIASARELTGDEFKSISDAIASARTEIAEADRAAARKFELRAIFGKHDEMSAGFVAIFADPQIMSAFRNLSFLCDTFARKSHDINETLRDIRATEAAHMRTLAASDDGPGTSASAADTVALREFDFPYVYETHLLMHSAVKIMGFSSVFDRRVHAIREVESRVGEAMPRVARLWAMICARFKVAPIRGGMTAQTFIESIKNTLFETYCIALVRMGDFYELALAKVFRVLPNGRLITVGG